MGLTKLSHDIQDRVQDGVSDLQENLSSFSWQRTVAAGSLIAGACLFLAGHRKIALAVAATGATVGLLEHPEAARELWESLPDYLHRGQDFLVKVEEFVDEVVKQGNKLKSSLG